MVVSAPAFPDLSDNDVCKGSWIGIAQTLAAHLLYPWKAAEVVALPGADAVHSITSRHADGLVGSVKVTL
jgi:hypothetical protein